MITALHSEYPSPGFYPNPFTERLYFITEKPVAIQIFNSNYQLVKTGTVKKSINLEELPSGLYFIQYTIGDRLKIQKVIKN